MLAKVAVYIGVIGAFVAAILGILRFGERLDTPRATEPSAATAAASPVPAGGHSGPAGGDTGHLALLRENVTHPLPLLLLQVVVIVVAARLAGGVARRFGQPAVIGEMIAGILLGPSLLGWVWPSVQGFIFPASSLGSLRLLAQIGVVIFMFLVGIDLDGAHLRGMAHAAVWVSHLSITVPFLLGCALSLAIYRTLAPPGTQFTAFALFMGVAMSITAFPVLARILEEKGLTRTPLGATAISCAAVDDVTAWCLLALVVTLVKAAALTGALVTFALTLAFVAVMLLVVKPTARRILGRREVAGDTLVVAGVAFLFLSALATEVIGIHALFGAFLAGAVMPRHPAVRSYLRRRLETFGSVLLLPLFFAFTGLRTEIGLLGDLAGWLTCAAIIGVAIAGKLGGTMIASRITGMSWPDSFALGALMNTRGLIELIVLNLGYDLGILSPRVFSMMVLMALVTTFMTAPLLQLWSSWKQRASVSESAAGAAA